MSNVKINLQSVDKYRQRCCDKGYMHCFGTSCRNWFMFAVLGSAFFIAPVVLLIIGALSILVLTEDSDGDSTGASAAADSEARLLQDAETFEEIIDNVSFSSIEDGQPTTLEGKVVFPLIRAWYLISLLKNIALAYFVHGKLMLSLRQQALNPHLVKVKQKALGGYDKDSPQR